MVTKACWAQRLSAETLRRDFKEVKDYLQRYRDTSETSESSSEESFPALTDAALVTSKQRLSHPQNLSDSSEMWEKNTALREKSDVLVNKRLEERNRWCWCRWCEPAGHAAITNLPSDVPTHSEILINLWGETIIDLSIDLWLLLWLAVTVALGKRRYFLLFIYHWILLKLLSEAVSTVSPLRIEPESHSLWSDMPARTKLLGSTSDHLKTIIQTLPAAVDKHRKSNRQAI